LRIRLLALVEGDADADAGGAGIGTEESAGVEEGVRTVGAGLEPRISLPIGPQFRTRMNSPSLGARVYQASREPES
jgi:hypothetical protein